MPTETKEAFSKAVGQTLQIIAFNELGEIELEMPWKVSPDKIWSGSTIWLEPFCARRFRRYKRLSKAFQKKLELISEPHPPHYKVEFDITLKDGVDIDDFGNGLLQLLRANGGFSCWPDQRRINGSAWLPKSVPDARQYLAEIYRIVDTSAEVEVSEIGEISEIEAQAS